MEKQRDSPAVGDHGKGGICHGIRLSSMMRAKQGSHWNQHPP